MAQTGVIRINESSHRTLRQLAETLGESMQTVLTKAIEEYRRKQFFEQLDVSFAALKNDPAAWQAEVEERSLSAGTLSDGLDADEVWTEDGRLVLGS